MSESNNLENGCTDYLNQLLDDDDCENQLNDVFTYETSSLNEQQTTKNDLNKFKNKPKIIIMGLRKSGKSSIQKVVFHKMQPNETLFLESSNKIIKDDIQTNSFLFFSIYTLPGELEALSTNEVNELLDSCDALVFVIDAQDDYSDALNMLNSAVIKAYKLNPNIKFEVFIHKVDCLSDDNKIEVQRDVRQRVIDDLSETGIISMLSFHLTSIYDHSIFEAFSKVVQKLIPQLPVLESLLNLFISTCQIEKSFLFDVVSKIYLATDSSAVDMQSYELLCDMIDVVIDISGIYGVKDENELATFDGCSSSTIKLNNQTVLYLREVNNFLALVCILREENFDKQGLIDYNFQVFKDAIQEIFSTKNDEIVQQSNGKDNDQYSIDDSSKNSSLIKNEKFNDDSSMTNN